MNIHKSFKLSTYYLFIHTSKTFKIVNLFYFLFLKSYSQLYEDIERKKQEWAESSKDSNPKNTKRRDSDRGLNSSAGARKVKAELAGLLSSLIEFSTKRVMTFAKEDLFGSREKIISVFEKGIKKAFGLKILPIEEFPTQ